LHPFPHNFIYSLKQEVESIKAEIFSKTDLTSILSKCIGLCKQLKLPDDNIKWLENELYGYQTGTRGITSSDQPLSKLYPHDPEYRYLEGEVRIAGGYNENTGNRFYGNIKYPMFFAHPISRLEEISKISSEEFLINVDINELPDSTRNAMKE
jgi:hypothetical protein